MIMIMTETKDVKARQKAALLFSLNLRLHVSFTWL